MLVAGNVALSRCFLTDDERFTEVITSIITVLVMFSMINFRLAVSVMSLSSTLEGELLMCQF